MRFRGIQFSTVLAASGAMGNFMEGYWYSRVEQGLKILNIRGLGFVSKTATLMARSGNTPFVYDQKYFAPAEIKPKSIKVDLLNNNVLNAVGLGNPGLAAFLNTGQWQKINEPFWISIMSIAGTPEERKQEMETMVALLLKEKCHFKSAFGLQINLSCPNTGHDTAGLSSEANDMVDIAAKLDVPIMAKFSIATASIDALLDLEKNNALDALCLSNTIPYHWLPAKEFYGELANQWHFPFGKTSPLQAMGGGGLSGRIIKPYVLHFIKKLRKAGFKKHINGGGGILQVVDVEQYEQAGSDSIFFASVIILRPWRVQAIIKKAEQLYL